MSDEFFAQRSGSTPTIYAYKLPNDTSRKGQLKIGWTKRSALARVVEQVGATRAEFKILIEENAMRNDGTTFSDHDVHKALRDGGFKNTDREWFKCKVENVKEAIIAVRRRDKIERARTLDFQMRPEQEDAVKKTAAYFKRTFGEEPDKPPHFLWNAKMRFGKTFAAYQLAKVMHWRKVLVLTFKPAVQSAWEDDLGGHIDFKGWQFISPGGLTYEDVDTKKPFVCFGSFQDYLGRNTSTGGIKSKNEWVHGTNWDCVILDEYHYGAWRKRAKELFLRGHDREIFEENKAILKEEGFEDIDFEEESLSADAYLYLSGTPFRAINSGEFIEEQIFNWTYSDEQRSKKNWQDKNGKNPYTSLPRMVLMTYELPPEIREIAMQGEFDEFDLNVFFAAEGRDEKGRFKYEDEVQKWLDHIRGASTTVDNLKLGTGKARMPFSYVPLLNLLSHTFWFLPNVASCHAMSNLLAQRQNRFYHDYSVLVVSGSRAGIGVAALPPVREAMDEPLKSKTITLSCGKLTTGVTVSPWTGIFMLRNLSTPETYFQAAFRVQSPWTMKNHDGRSPNSVEIIKKECYVFDFAPDRALRQIVDYSTRLNVEEENPIKKVEEFISFLPVLSSEGGTMMQINAEGILDIVNSGTSATMLARRWDSAQLVNVDNDTLAKLMSNEAAMNALMKIPAFRNMNMHKEIEIIISNSEAIKKVRKEKKKRVAKEKKKLTAKENELKSKRTEIQKKLRKFATRIPLFMYLTDYREQTLKDVITREEPGLFKTVTGLSVKDFEVLVSLGVFNSALMNAAIWGFRRYEEASLEYMGINKHDGEDIGLYDDVVKASEFVNIPAED